MAGLCSRKASTFACGARDRMASGRLFTTCGTATSKAIAEPNIGRTENRKSQMPHPVAETGDRVGHRTARSLVGGGCLGLERFGVALAQLSLFHYAPVVVGMTGSEAEDKPTEHQRAECEQRIAEHARPADVAH